MPKVIKENFSQRLAKIRKVRGLTQEELAKMTGLTRRMIAHYETKIKELPHAKVIMLAKILNISIDELMGHTPTKEKELIKNRNLIKKIKILDNLPLDDQKTIVKHIDDLNAKYSISKSK